jgi:heat shock protein HtpX
VVDPLAVVPVPPPPEDEVVVCAVGTVPCTVAGRGETVCSPPQPASAQTSPARTRARARIGRRVYWKAHVEPPLSGPEQQERQNYNFGEPLQGETTLMKRKAFGRDAGLTVRMLVTSGLLGLLYVAFALVLFYVLNAGLGLMLVIVIGIGLLQYFTSDKLALAASGAKVVERDQAPELHDMVERLCALADLPKPRIAVVDTDVPNAFATGRNPKRAVVAVTTGLWRRLDPKEIEAVLAHELSHVANRDVLIMTVASFFALLAATLTRFGLYAGMFGGGYSNRDSNNNNAIPVWLIVVAVSIVTYALSFILIRTISRYREYVADRGSALLTGAPENLMSALQRISSDMMRIPQRDLREVAGMNAFFIIPTSVKERTAELFMDHPPLEKRLAALARIAREMGRPVAV